MFGLIKLGLKPLMQISISLIDLLPHWHQSCPWTPYLTSSPEPVSKTVSQVCADYLTFLMFVTFSISFGWSRKRSAILHTSIENNVQARCGCFTWRDGCSCSWPARAAASPGLWLVWASPQMAASWWSRGRPPGARGCWWRTRSGGSRQRRPWRWRSCRVTMKSHQIDRGRLTCWKGCFGWSYLLTELMRYGLALDRADMVGLTSWQNWCGRFWLQPRAASGRHLTEEGWVISGSAGSSLN